jgi:hypothetical protein
MTHYDARPYTVVLIDVAGSASHTNPWQLRMRTDLRTIIINVLKKQRHDSAGVDLNDTGDGMRLICPPEISVIGLLAHFVPDLASALRAHRTATPDAGLRLRVAVDVGLLHRDHGWHGTPLIMCTRLCDAGPVRRVLRAAEQADLVVVVSARVHQEVVRHGYDGINPTTYGMVKIQEKETLTEAWVHVPGYTRPPGIRDGEDPTGPPAALGIDQAHSPAVTMIATTLGESRAYQAGRDQYINER